MAGRPLAAAVAVGLAATVLMAGCAATHRRPPRPAVYEIVVDDAPGRDVLATGFALGGDRVLTVAHVLQGRRAGSAVRVRVPGARGGGRAARVLAVDETDDLALLSVGRLAAPVPALATTSDMASGPAVILVLRRHRVTALPTTVVRLVTARIQAPDGSGIVRRPAVELRGEVDPGDSGAPVLTRDGRVAGVVFATAATGVAVTFATRASAASAVTSALPATAAAR